LVPAVRRPTEVAGVGYCLEAAVGLSPYPHHAATLPELVRTGVFACYQAQRTDAGVATFDRSRDELKRDRFRLMIDLENAFTSGDGIQSAY
jgi:predicted signal transduction protein with EAL and GGDEF domain